jgi:hypothetical protein
MAMRIAELRESECCPVIGQIEVALPFFGQRYFAGNGADFSVMLKLETVCRTNKCSLFTVSEPSKIGLPLAWLPES